MALGSRIGICKWGLMYTLRNKAVFKISFQEYKVYFFSTYREYLRYFVLYSLDFKFFDVKSK